MSYRDRDALEKILGGAIEQRGQRAVPGLSPVEGVEFVYYEDDGKSKAKKQFNVLLDSAGVITATSGGVVSDSCKIYLPDDPQFHALSYHGGIEGWRKAFEAVAKARGLPPCPNSRLCPMGARSPCQVVRWNSLEPFYLLRRSASRGNDRQ